MTAVNDLPVSWAKRLADLSSWSSSRIVVRMRQSILVKHQYVKSRSLLRKGSVYLRVITLALRYPALQHQRPGFRQQALLN
jgi:hypothetical protein